ncbi:YbgA family protein, partial [Legionella tunisiensis]|uniref:YbgA family protein n=1 Tax=Legionella tunisiensis TaxID=1034944 RepID=UPI000378998A
FSQNIMTDLKHLSGYILKSKSPTCGWKQVKIYQSPGLVKHNGQGLYAKTLAANYPCLPIEEEGRLNDPRLRENFVERIFLYKEWQDLVGSGLTIAKILAFHTRHKLTLMAHHPITSHKLGEALSRINKQDDIQQFAENYIYNFMQILSYYIATPKKHANVLQHCLGYFKKVLNKIDKQELVESIANYRQGLLPLIVPVTLLKHHMKHHRQPYLDNQSYLSPYPEELMLRNHI